MNPIKQEINKIAIPSRLHEHSVRGVERAKRERKGSGRGWLKKQMLAAVLAAALIVPTTAFAYQTLLADELYGSFQEVKNIFSVLRWKDIFYSMQNYYRLKEN